MTAKHALQTIVQSLHRHFFHSVPNTGPREVDLSRLKSVVAHEVQEYSIEIDVHFTKQAMQSLESILPTIPYEDRVLVTSSKFTPEPWDAND
jgi:hypothetical protein